MRRSFRAAAWPRPPSHLHGRRARRPVDRLAGRSGPGGLLYRACRARLTAANLGLNDLADPAPGAEGADAEAPVVTHAIAPAVPESFLDEEPAPRSERSLAELVGDYSGTDTPDPDTDCLARAVYWESKGEPLAGQLAVAEVIINRANRAASLRPSAASCASAANSPSSAAAISRSRPRPRATGGSRSRSPRSRCRTSPTAPRRGRSSSTPAGSIRAGG